jgi:pimeloyl-ACP methyl ester carboxylesterase
MEYFDGAAERDVTNRGTSTRVFRMRRPAPIESIDALSVESQAALRQFTVERLASYGVAREDAAELLDRVIQGERWQSVALAMARDVVKATEVAPSRLTRVNTLRRASALLRAGQMMMISDNLERREIFARASELYLEAAQIAVDRSRFELSTDTGTIVGWHFEAPDPVAAAIVFGGVEGWAMDFAAMGEDMARRGIDAYLIDGPGQGESRLRWGHYLTRGWMATWRQIVDHVVTQARTLPLFIVGNSMGGCLVMNYAPTDERIAGICSNGGPRRAPSLAGELPSKLKKFHVFCGDVPIETAEAVWGSLDSAQAMARSRQPLLILHGGFDPLVTETEVLEILHMAGSDDRTLVIFSDGDHCVYNHPDDKHNLVGDWILERAAPGR